jgi:pilus assembly protein Flp/PilA
LSKDKLAADAHSEDKYWRDVIVGRSGKIRGTQTWQVLRGVLIDASAATAAEYALILGLIGTSIAIASVTLGDSIACSIDRSAAVVAGQDPSGYQYGNSDPNGLAKGHHINC